MPGGARATPPAASVARDLAGALFSYTKIAWWGLARPRLERCDLVVLQGVIVGDEGILLSVRADLRGWELPGGTLQAGESHGAALCREILEETGLVVSVERHVGDYVRTGFRPHVAKVYRCRPTGGALATQRGETRALGWFQQDALPETLFPWYRRPLDDALRRNGDAGPPVRVEEHQGARAILHGLAIDLRMRLSGDAAGLR